MKSYTTLRNNFGSLSNNTSTANLTLGDQLINDSLRYLTTKYFFNERTYTVPGGTIASTGVYDLPYNIKTIINVYVTIGSIRYQLTEAPTRTFFDSLNFVPYTSDIPQYYFIYNKKINIFPLPASNGNAITINYKTRLEDLSQADYSTGTVVVTNGSKVVTGTGTTFTPQMVGSWIRVTPASSATTYGDGNWYEIGSYTSSTVLGLVNNYEGATTLTTAYTIGEMPILPEDYQDLPVYRALSIYFTTRVPDPTRAAMFDTLYKEGFAKLDAEFGSKSNSVAITPNDSEVINPNLFARNLS